MWLSPGDLARWRALAKVENARMRECLEGETWNMGSHVGKDRLAQIEWRRIAVDELYRDGWTRQAIADALSVSLNTVKNDLGVLNG